ncbi:FAD-dependent thymidylate synthase [Corynebacterium sp. Marseille-P4321]|uniref:FAD-dependent thymidylate synthase n=1 Tax=Corynebacterium sp. Marseille-P4321 TaxID=2736603 RepID=UPI00158BEEF7|nr:FAD-dependent thymidylate synthase [Corynebacterium sp. Marseille-P4321]
MLDVTLVAATQFHGPAADTVATDAEAAVEYAARLHGSSLPPAALLRQLIDDSDAAALEHATATMHLSGISRDAAYVVAAHTGFAVTSRDKDATLIPAAIAEDEELSRIFTSAVEEAAFVRDELVHALEEAMADEPNALARRKAARQAADAVLPAARETELVVTGNYRAWREFIAAHTGEFEHPEINALARACLQVLKVQAPLLVEDLGDGARR